MGASVEVDDSEQQQEEKGSHERDQDGASAPEAVREEEHALELYPEAPASYPDGADGSPAGPAVVAKVPGSVASGKQLCAALLTGACCLTPVGQAAHATGTHGPPNDPLFKHQWHLRVIQAEAAWATSRGKGVTVAVLDTGVAYETRGRYRRAPDLAGTRFAGGWDFVDGDAHPNDEPPPERQSHGTHIAGVIAQTTNNRLGAAGVAPEATIMPIRVLRPDLSGSAKTIARGLRFAADHGAEVANLSLAGPRGARVLEEAIAYASAKGVTIVASAGNGGRASISFPAAYRNVIAVGALSRDGSLAYYSNRGEALDLVAPGGDTQVADGGGGQAGDGVLQQTLRGGPSTFCYCAMASTSAAAAQVAGTAALLIASGRATRPVEVESALRSGARDLGPRGPDRDHGAGLVQAARALSAANGPAPEPPAAPADSRASGWPWYAWAAVALAGIGSALLLARSLQRRGRQVHQR